MEYEELNRKLAEWVGLQWKLATNGEKHWFDGENICSPTIDGQIPFTSSLNACFKWLVPKLLGGVMIEFGRWGEGWSVEINTETDDRYTAYGETPALALCKAIEQLIEKEA